jgi:hypothetical protein
MPPCRRLVTADHDNASARGRSAPRRKSGKFHQVSPFAAKIVIAIKRFNFVFLSRRSLYCRYENAMKVIFSTI